MAAIATQEEQLAKVNESLKAMSRFEEVLQKYEKVADGTTQRAIVTLREQVKADLQREIPVAAAKATVLTAQTPGSYRLEPSTQGMVLRILDAHAGRLEVESTPGKGTTMSVVLPVADA